MSQSMAAVRSTPVRPSPACGAAIQPTSTTRMSTARPAAAAATAAIAPVITSGRPASSGAGLPAALPPGLALLARVAEVVTTPASQLAARQARRRAARPATAGAVGPAAWAPAAGRPSARLHELPHELRGPARRPAHAHADLLQRFLLGLGRAGRARDDGARVAHRLALGRGEARHVGDHGLGHVLLDEGRRPLFRVAADLADHDDRVGLRVLLERPQAVDVGSADDRVPADADGRREADV